MSNKRKHLLILVLVVVGFIGAVSMIASRYFLVDIPWMVMEKGPMCGPANGFINPAEGCPTGYMCDFSNSTKDGLGYCLKK